MIVKKITRRGGAGGVAERRYARTVARYIVRAGQEDLAQLLEVSDDDHVRSLAHYVLSTGREEKVLANGQFNLVAEDLEGWLIEVDALRQRRGRKTPCTDHWVMSWHTEDRPEVQEMTEAARIFLESQGLERCPVIWAVHDDTDNPHLHMMITRVDRLSGNAVAAGQGWDIDCAHRAAARIHAVFPQWTAEPNAVYRVEKGRLVHTETGTYVGPAHDPAKWRRQSTRTRSEPTPKAMVKLDDRALNYESSTGWKSHQRVALEEAVPIMLSSNSWDEAQAKLGRLGIGLEKTRAGGNFVLGNARVALGVDRRTTFGKLAKRYGSDRLEPNPAVVAEFVSRPLTTDPRLGAYHTAKRQHAALVREACDAIAAVDIIAGQKPGAARKVAAASLARHSFPSFQAWCAGAQPSPLEIETIGVAGLSGYDPLPRAGSGQAEIGPFIGLKRRDGIHYRLADAPAGRTAFIDTGKLLVSDTAVTDAALASMLVIAHARWPGNVQAFGDAEFRQRAERLAAQLGLPLKPAHQDRMTKWGPIVTSRVAHSEVAGSASASHTQSGTDVAAATRRRLALISQLFHSDWDRRDYLPPRSTSESVVLGHAKRQSDHSKSSVEPSTQAEADEAQRAAMARAAANAFRNGMGR